MINKCLNEYQQNTNKELSKKKEEEEEKEDNAGHETGIK
jgi:hypothetical protein